MNRYGKVIDRPRHARSTAQLHFFIAMLPLPDRVKVSILLADRRAVR
jgi:hypothetical protein